MGKATRIGYRVKNRSRRLSSSKIHGTLYYIIADEDPYYEQAWPLNFLYQWTNVSFLGCALKAIFCLVTVSFALSQKLTVFSLIQAWLLESG